MNGKGIHITSRIAGGILVAACVCVLALHSKAVQRRLVHIVEDKLAEALDGRITFSSLRVSSYGAFVLKDALVLDPTPYTADSYRKGYAPTDTLLYAKTVSATFTLKGLMSNEGLHLGRVNISDGGMYVVSEPKAETGRLSNTEILFKPVQIDSDFVAQPGPNIFDIKRVKVSGFRFRLINYNPPLSPTPHIYCGKGINFEDMDVTADVRVHDLKMAGGRMSGTLDHLNAVEKSGYRVKHVGGHASVGLGEAYIGDIHIVDNWSDIKLEHLTMTFKNALSLQDFVNKVSFDSDFRRTKVAMKSVNCFCDGSLGDNMLLIEVSSGHVEGPVNGLEVTGLKFKDLYSGMSGETDAEIRNVVPNVSNMTIKGKASDIRFDSKQISDFLNCWTQIGGTSLDFSAIAKGLPVTANAGCSGRLDDFSVNGALSIADAGQISVNGKLYDILDKTRPISLNGHLTADGLDIGRAISSDKLGLLDAEAAASLVLGKDIDITLDSLRVYRLGALGYDFRDILIKGALEDNTLSAQLHSADTALRADLVALADLVPFDGNRRYKIAADLSDIDLKATGLDKRGGSSNVSANVYGSFVQNGKFLLGDAFIDKVRLTDDGGTKDIGNVELRAFRRDSTQHLRFVSPFADVAYTGSEPLGEFIKDLQDITLREYLPSLQNKAPSGEEGGDYDVEIAFHDSRSIMSYILPNLYIADSTRFNLAVRGPVLKAGLNSSRVAIGANNARAVNLGIDNSGKELKATLRTDGVTLGGIEIEKPALTALAKEDIFTLNLHYDNTGSDTGEGDINIGGSLSRDESDSLTIRAFPLESHISDGIGKWEFGRSEITLTSQKARIDSLLLTNGNQHILVDGGLRNGGGDSLKVDIANLDLALVDNLLSTDLGLAGVTSGRAVFTSFADNTPGMLVNIACDSLSIGGEPVGDFRIASAWDDSGKGIRARVQNTLRGEEILNAEGTYNPSEKRFGARADFNKFALAAAAPFLRPIFSEMGGTVSGTLQAGGGAEDISVSSEGFRLDDALVRVGVTDVPYTINGPVKVDDSGIYLENISIRDGGAGTGRLDGTISHNKLKDINIDARMRIRDLQVVATPEDKAESFYGNLRASGNIVVSGPIESLLVNADLSTSGDGDVHIPLSGALTSTSGNLLTFTEPAREIDPYEQMLMEYATASKKSSGDFTARGSVRINPGLKAYMEIDKSVGNIISFNGEGTVGLELRPSKSVFNLNGDYNISSGNYHFVLPGILEKDFEIQQGSNLRFGGALMDSQINIDAIHNVKTSLTALLSDSTVVATRRLVECGLSISNKLSNPEISFSVNVPDLDPTTKSKVEGAMNTDDKVQTQFVALLLAGTFIPSEQSGVFNGTNVLYSNIGEMVSNRINSIFSKLSIPLDIGLGYQEQSGGNNVFDVAISTQLFNNRVVVNGSLGNRNDKYATSAGSTGDIVGDLDIEYKLDKEGQFRISAFSHSADDNNNFIDHSQRNGLGVSYQNEFNTFGEFLRNLFTSKKKRRQALQSEENGDITINIQSENEQTISHTRAARRQRSRGSDTRERPEPAAAD